MLTAYARACAQFRGHRDDESLVWGWRSRTLSARIIINAAPRWMRLATRPREQLATLYWHGNTTAERTMATSVPRPKVLQVVELHDCQWAYAGELFEWSPTPPASPVPAAFQPIRLPDTWLEQLHRTLTTVAAIPTKRHTINPGFPMTTAPQILGHALAPHHRKPGSPPTVTCTGAIGEGSH